MTFCGPNKWMFNSRFEGGSERRDRTWLSQLNHLDFCWLITTVHGVDNQLGPHIDLVVHQGGSRQGGLNTPQPDYNYLVSPQPIPITF